MRPVLLAILMLLCIPIALSQAPQDAFFSSGFEFLVPSTNQPTLFILYDDTQVYFDINNDKINDYTVTYDQGTATPVFAWNIQEGSRISSNKPIVYEQTLDTLHQTQGSNTYNLDIKTIVPPLFQYKTTYHIYPGTWTIVTNTPTQISVLNTITLSEQIIQIDSPTQVTASHSSIITSPTPILVYAQNTIASNPSTDFIATDTQTQLYIIQENTTVQIDINADGAYDQTTEYTTGQHTIQTLPGSLIHCSNICSMYNRYTISNTYERIVALESFSKSSNEHIGTSADELITSFNQNTSVILYNHTDYSVIESKSVESNKVTPITAIGARIVTDKPSIFIQSTSRQTISKPCPSCYSQYYYTQKILPASAKPSISMHSMINEKYTKLNQNVEMSHIIANTYKETTATHLELELTLQSAFSVTSTQLHVIKRSLVTDTIIDEEMLSVSQSLLSTTPLNENNVAMFNELGPQEYITITYSITSPSTAGYYETSTQQLRYTAPVWSLN